MNYIGSATLESGTVTVSNSSVKNNTLITITRKNRNGSTSLGDIVYTIDAGNGFTINSVSRSNPSNIETNDNSIVDYLVYLMP